MNIPPSQLWIADQDKKWQAIIIETSDQGITCTHIDPTTRQPQIFLTIPWNTIQSRFYTAVYKSTDRLVIRLNDGTQYYIKQRLVPHPKQLARLGPMSIFDTFKLFVLNVSKILPKLDQQLAAHNVLVGDENIVKSYLNLN